MISRKSSCLQRTSKLEKKRRDDSSWNPFADHRRHRRAFDLLGARRHHGGRRCRCRHRWPLRPQGFRPQSLVLSSRQMPSCCLNYEPPGTCRHQLVLRRREQQQHTSGLNARNRFPKSAPKEDAPRWRDDEREVSEPRPGGRAHQLSWKSDSTTARGRGPEIWRTSIAGHETTITLTRFEAARTFGSY